jgi:glycosyltransferase involved in cell wall biosynthesis
MKKELKKEIKNFDIIHVHDFRTYQNVLIHRYAKRYDVPYILQAHGDAPILAEKQTLKRLYDGVWGNNILKDASKTLALNQTEVDNYRKCGVRSSGIEIVPNGIDLSEYDNLSEKGIFRKKYGINNDEKIVLYLGRLHKIKGLDLLVDAFSDLVKRKDNIKLVIVGPNDGYLSILKRQIDDLALNDKVLLTGPLYGNEKLSAYVDADVYVLPSVYDAFPNTVLEAWACGTPVIVTDRCGIANLVDDKVGCVVEFDKNQLRDAMFKILSDKELRMRFGGNGRKLVEERFDWSKIVNRVDKVYSASKNELR